MTNKDRYKQAFGALHASETFTLEDKPMMRRRDNKKFYLPKQVIAACLTVVVFLGSFSVVYAMNLGGIRKTIQLWIHGDAKDAEITFDGEGSYSLTYTDESGKTQERSGGGVAMDGLGQERPLTPEELIDELDSPETLVKEDGSIWLSVLTDIFSRKISKIVSCYEVFIR